MPPSHRYVCPECDRPLFKAPARKVKIQVAWHTGAPLLPCDLVYCCGCGWCRFATADDVPMLDLIPEDVDPWCNAGAGLDW